MNPLYTNYANTVGMPVEDSIPRQMVYSIFPAMEDLYSKIVGLLAVWENPVNDVNAGIAAAKTAVTDYGSYDPDDVARMGGLLLRFVAFYETSYTITLADEVTTEDATPLTLMTTRYVPMGS